MSRKRPDWEYELPQDICFVVRVWGLEGFGFFNRVLQPLQGLRSFFVLRQDFEIGFALHALVPRLGLNPKP